MKAFLLSTDAVSDNVLAMLGSRTRPGWVIEPRSRRVLAANKAGLAELGLKRGCADVKLDHRMPALLRLQEIARSPQRRKRLREELVFWAPRGSIALSCDVIATKGAAAGALVVLGGARESGAKARVALLSAAAGRKAAAPRPNARQALSEFVPKLAHELKTPLSAIAAAAEIMKDERLGPLANTRYRGYAADIYEAACHALSVIDRMLGAATSARPRGAAPDRAGVVVNATAESAVSQMVPLAKRAGIRLAKKLEPGLPRVAADATSVRQILFNLLTNALKFTGAGGTVKVITRCARDGLIEVEVRDTGRGMTRSEVARSLDATKPRRRKRRKGGGLGLGLPLVRALAEAMGASLTIESTPGRGTSARVTFARAGVDRK